MRSTVLAHLFPRLPRILPGFVLLFASAALLAFTWNHYATTPGRGWAPAPAKVVDARIYERSEGPRFEAWVRFEHEVEGKKVTGHSGERFAYEADAREAMPLVGQRITIRRDPLDPTRATAAPLPSTIGYLGMVAAALFAAACGAGFLVVESEDRPTNSGRPEDWSRWGPAPR